MYINKTSPPALPAPWWTFGFVWMVIAGPASVVLASIATVWITLAYPETLVAEDYYRRGMQINKTLAEQAQRDRALVPALQGRNHAASPAPAPTAPAPAPPLTNEILPVPPTTKSPPQATLSASPQPGRPTGLSGPTK